MPRSPKMTEPKLARNLTPSQKWLRRRKLQDTNFVSIQILCFISYSHCIPTNAKSSWSNLPLSQLLYDWLVARLRRMSFCFRRTYASFLSFNVAQLVDPRFRQLIMGRHSCFNHQSTSWPLYPQTARSPSVSPFCLESPSRFHSCNSSYRSCGTTAVVHRCHLPY